jgi:beta-lactamase superfamily II metal-dependent hydrolase
MSFEIDFLPVGQGEKSGDAIALRYGNLSGPRSEQTVLIVDGGTLDSGAALVDHVKKYYKTEYVNGVISTHPDLDHACGLKVVLEKLDFGALVMHKPWEHAPEIADLFDQPLVPSKLKEKLRKAVSAAHELKVICKDKKKQVIEPVPGNLTKDGVVKLLGPSRAYYQLLLANFRETPTPKSSVSQILQKAGWAVKDAVEWVAESMSLDFEALDDSGETSPENNSSMILLLAVDGGKALLTADAGIPGLTAAADYAAGCGIMLNDLDLMQLPHHGSAHNVGPTILNRVMGNRVYISAGPTAPRHPARKVTNAVRRRGGVSSVTAGGSINFGFPTIMKREGWGPVPEIPFYAEVEA